MTKVRVRPDAIGFGDRIEINDVPYLVTSVEGPDEHLAFDFYLIGRDGIPVHKIVTESVALWYE